MPVARRRPRQHGDEALARERGIVLPVGREVEADAAHARRRQCIEVALRGLFVDHRDAARVRTARPQAVERGWVIGAVDARCHDHDASDAQRPMYRRHLAGQCGRRRVDAPGEERKRLRIAEYMRVAVAGVRRHIEIRRRCGLRGDRGIGWGLHRASGSWLERVPIKWIRTRSTFLRGRMSFFGKPVSTLAFARLFRPVSGHATAPHDVSLSL